MIRIRKYEEANYKAIFFDGKTIRSRIDKTKPFSTPPTPELEDIGLNTLCVAACFIEGMHVLTDEGERPIESIKVGDSVISYDTDLHQFEEKSVYQLFKNPYKGDLVKIVLENSREIYCTPNHKFFTGNRGWVMASDLTNLDDIVEYGKDLP